MAENLRSYRHYVISGASKADFTKDATSYDKISKSGEQFLLRLTLFYPIYD